MYTAFVRLQRVTLVEYTSKNEFFFLHHKVYFLLNILISNESVASQIINVELCIMN